MVIPCTIISVFLYGKMFFDEILKERNVYPYAVTSAVALPNEGLAVMAKSW